MKQFHTNEALENVVKTALRAYTVRLVFKSWDFEQSANYCKLALVRDIFGGHEAVHVDSKEPSLDLRTAPPISFGSTEDIGAQSVSGYLQRQVRLYTDALLSGLRFRVVLQDCRFPAVWIALERVDGEIPRGMSIPRQLETSALSLIPKDSVWHQHYTQLTHPHLQVRASDSAADSVTVAA